MNILVITPFYKQDKNIASVRWTKLCARLAKKHNVFVETQPIINSDTKYSVITDEKIKVQRIDQQTFYEKIAVKFFGGASGDDWQTKTSQTNEESPKAEAGEPFTRKLKNKMFYASAYKTAKRIARKICGDLISKNEKCDVVISSACPFIEMFIGYEAAKRLNAKWICEFRDLPFTEEISHDNLLQKAYMQRYLSSADAVVTIAPKGKEFLYEHGLVKDKNKIHVITNGFSKDDIQNTARNDVSDTVKIVHTGSLYGGDRKADMLFEAIDRAKKIDSKAKFAVSCAGGNSQSIVDAAKKYGLCDIVTDRGFVTRNEALKMQQESDILLMLVKAHPGSLAAKIFEYMLSNKPVISVTCGKLPDSEETRFVNNLNLGLAVEEADGEQGREKLTRYLLECSKCKREKKPIPFSPNKEKIALYDHDNLVLEYEKLIKSICV